MQLVSTVTVGAGGAASIEFTGIPQTGTDLLLVVSPRVSLQFASVGVRFNNDSGSNYSRRVLRGNGSAASSRSDGTDRIFFGISSGTGDTANTFGSMSLYIPNYAGSQAKSTSSESVSESNATTAFQDLVAGRWSGTAAITTLTLSTESVDVFLQHSTASLYIITKA
jgi:hypothetical protein